MFYVSSMIYLCLGCGFIWITIWAQKEKCCQAGWSFLSKNAPKILFGFDTVQNPSKATTPPADVWDLAFEVSVYTDGNTRTSVDTKCADHDLVSTQKRMFWVLIQSSHTSDVEVLPLDPEWIPNTVVQHAAKGNSSHFPFPNQAKLGARGWREEDTSMHPSILDVQPYLHLTSHPHHTVPSTRQDIDRIFVCIRISPKETTLHSPS